MIRPNVPRCFAAAGLTVSLFAGAAPAADQSFRPEPGKSPPPEKAKAYQGQLAFVDHANRRGSLRSTGGELFHSTAPILTPRVLGYLFPVLKPGTNQELRTKNHELTT